MKAGIFDPYLDTIGGGERYCLTLAEYLASNGWQVEVFWSEKDIKEKLCEKLNLNLKRVNFVSSRIFDSKGNLFKRWQKGRSYDLLFFVSDGSVPLMFGKKNILHFQVPFMRVNGNKVSNKIKFRMIDNVICNSFFTKKFIDKEFGLDSQVIYPPVAVDEFKPEKKENIILSVGRFSQIMQAKGQDVLVRGFKQLIKTNENLLRDKWKLVLAGGTAIEGENFLKRIRKMAKGFPIEIITNATFESLQSLYGKAKIFWSASGFGFDDSVNPEKVEHFGITTVEAMAAGCVPVVIAKGGQKEIVEDKVSGFLWKREADLLTSTMKLIQHESLRKKIAVQSIKTSKQFSKKVFGREFERIIV